MKNEQVVFKNLGEIDPRAITTFGVSVKECNSPIGYFGTGLKYAIAILMREGCELTIFSGETELIFTTKEVAMRGKTFKVITMNDEELPFTTELGKNWEMWQAFREIYCNCLDEQGEVDLFGEEARREGQDDRTYFIVRGPKFVEQYHNRHNIHLNLPADTALVNNGKVQVFNKPSSYLFYRGIRVLQYDTQASLTYNIIGSLDLTEDRTMKYPFQRDTRIARAISSIQDQDVLFEVLAKGTENLERMTDFSGIGMWAEDISEEFIDFLEKCYMNNNDKVPNSAIKYLVDLKNKKSRKNYEPITLDDVEVQQLKRAEDICNTLFKDFKDYEILPVKTLGQSILGLADTVNGRIILSRGCFEMGTKYLTSTMIEEYMHLKTGYNDHTRELQTYLFDTICTLTEKFIIEEPI